MKLNFEIKISILKKVFIWVYFVLISISFFFLNEWIQNIVFIHIFWRNFTTETTVINCKEYFYFECPDPCRQRGQKEDEQIIKRTWPKTTFKDCRGLEWKIKDSMNNLSDNLSELSPPLLCYLKLIDYIQLYQYIKEMLTLFN